MAAEMTFPRKKHSHRCQTCGQGTYCYKTRCSKPQKIERCTWCPKPEPEAEPTYDGPMWECSCGQLNPGAKIRCVRCSRDYNFRIVDTSVYPAKLRTISGEEEPALPGMENCDAERAEVKALELAEDLTTKLASTKGNIDRKAGQIETLSPLFRGKGPQGELF